MKLLKLLIPSGKKEINEIPSWTVEWHSLKIGHYDPITNYKCFQCSSDAYEFEKALKEATALLKTSVRVSVYQN